MKLKTMIVGGSLILSSYSYRDMRPPLNSALLQNPQWWYESWGIADWLGTLFNQPLEVHTFLLGAFIGVLLAAMTASRHPRTTLTFTLVVVLFTFGSFETAITCSEEFTACQHIQLKPWYFIGGFMTAHLGALGVVGSATRHDSTGDDSNRTAASPLAGIVVLALLGFAGYSFVSPTPVHPITGLATIGGCLGAALGLAAYEWAAAEPDSEFRAVLRQTLWNDLDESILVVGYGTVLGFGYPRLFWELGEVVGHSDFLFGPIVWARNGLPSVVLYVFVLFLLTLVLFGIRVRRRNTNGVTGQTFAALVLGFVTYAFCLFVLTGYAGILWFRAVPSA